MQDHSAYQRPTTPTKHKQPTKSGFTIIEVSLATALLSVLLIAISVIIVNIINIYQKGTTLKNIDSVGRSLVKDFNAAINASLPTEKISTTNSANTKSFSQYYQKTPQKSGAVCFGQYSYLWAAPGVELKLKYAYGGNNNRTYSNIRLLKIKDWRRQVCTNYSGSSATVDISKYNGSDGGSYYLPEEPQELLLGNDINLYIYDLTLNKIDGNIGLNQSSLKTGEAFFSGTFVLGTERDANINYTNTKLSNCEVSVDDADSADFNYCAVNQFKFAARTAGKVE